ncbi:uncharacterized protein LOC129587208 [Paramacrobiotus metropolitanus]|uniref:uncharacterized protein LOC129587208 n=1 Tax=Paramacrobiotus metropolitanus TaxID=2943436 RepID=UPI0024461306|nr:uncharacterized protein LOC129587208 [Paramacrobiotus metropolitanus]
MSVFPVFFWIFAIATSSFPSIYAMSLKEVMVSRSKRCLFGCIIPSNQPGQYIMNPNTFQESQMENRQLVVPSALPAPQALEQPYLDSRQLSVPSTLSASVSLIPTWQVNAVALPQNGTTAYNPYPPALPTDYYGSDTNLLTVLQTLFVQTVALSTVPDTVKLQLQNAMVFVIISPGCTVDVRSVVSSALTAMSAVTGLPDYARRQIATANNLLLTLDCSSTQTTDLAYVAAPAGQYPRT